MYDYPKMPNAVRRKTQSAGEFVYLCPIGTALRGRPQRTSIRPNAHVFNPRTFAGSDATVNIASYDVTL